MTKEELEQLAEKYQAKADRAYNNYQETGIQRYDRERYNNERLADALRMAADASTDHNALLFLRADIAMLAHKAQQGEDITKSLLSAARMHGLIGKDDGP